MNDKWNGTLIVIQLSLICVQLGLIANRLAALVEKMP